MGAGGELFSKTQVQAQTQRPAGKFDTAWLARQVRVADVCVCGWVCVCVLRARICDEGIAGAHTCAFNALRHLIVSSNAGIRGDGSKRSTSSPPLKPPIVLTVTRSMMSAESKGSCGVRSAPWWLKRTRRAPSET